MILQYSEGKIFNLKPGTLVLLGGQYAVIVKTRYLCCVSVKAHKEHCKNPDWYTADKVEMIFTDNINMMPEFLKLIKKYK